MLNREVLYSTFATQHAAFDNTATLAQKFSPTARPHTRIDAISVPTDTTIISSVVDTVHSC